VAASKPRLEIRHREIPAEPGDELVNRDHAVTLISKFSQLPSVAETVSIIDPDWQAS
jgi:hypothetical protein